MIGIVLFVEKKISGSYNSDEIIWLLNIKDKIIAAVVPSHQTISELVNHIKPNQKEELLSKIKENKPF